MGDDGDKLVQPRRSRSWIRWLLVGLAAIFLVLAVFHGPILRAVLHTVAVKVAAAQNLKLDFRMEGGILGGITLRNLHATATGPSAVQSLDADLIRADYSLTDLAFHGMSDFLKDIEVRNVTAVIDPSKAPLATPTPPPQDQKISLPTYFPERLQVSNVNLTVRGEGKDTVLRNFNVGLYPDKEGALRIDRLQIPNVHDWKDITATTTYAKKNLFLRNLTFDEGHHFQTINIDASKAGGGKLELQVTGSVGEGTIEGNIGLSTTKSSFETQTKVKAAGISLGQLSEYFGRPAGALAGEVKNFQMDWKGALDTPQSWEGTIKADINDVRQNGIALDHVGLDVVAENGTAMVREARIDRGTNHMQLNGTVQLPKTTEGFRRTPGDLKLTVDAPNLKELTAFLPTPVTGSLQASGTIKTEQSIARLELTAKGDLIGYDKAAVKELSARISATKKLPATDASEEPFYANLTSSIQAELNDVRYDQYVVDRVRAEVKSNDATVSLEPVSLQRKANQLLVRGTYQLPPPEGKALEQPADLQLTLRAPQLADFWKDEALNKVRGELHADGSFSVRKGVANGQLTLSGQEIAAQKLLVKQLNAQVAIAQNVVYLNDLTATLNDKDYVLAHGTFALQQPYKYTGVVTANLADLSTFEPLLATEEKKTALAGSLVVNWNGQGEAATFKNNGDLKLTLEKGRYADLTNLQAKVEAHYTPEELNVPIIFFGSDPVSLTSSLTAKGELLEISRIQIDQGAAKYATAYVALPFIWRNLGTDRKPFPPNGKVNISFQSENLDLAKLFRDLGKEPPVTGQLSVKLDAEGPLDQLRANLDLKLQSLQADAVKQLKPTDINLALRLQDNRLKADGTIKQPLIQPVQITAQLPFNVAEVMAQKKVDEQTPLNVKVQMPRSSINFVREFVPALRQLDGSLALNVNVGGTIAKPDLSGAADMNINVARFENATLPALTNFKGLLNFRDNTLNFDRFGGDLAGGPFTLAGRITLPKLTEPNFDLRLKANSVLVARNDNLTARVDADIKVEGPLNSASVSGQVLTTNSRFLKNIDIIPISLPGRPAPLPEPPSAAPALSFPNPPLRDWKFDVAIKSKEPFLIRGNLAAGSANIDMKMAGTGLHPQLQGQVRLENFEATLPFSTLTINLGFLYFDPDDPLNPRIEMQGTSLIQDYTVHVYIYGTALKPEAVFSSEPPLPQEDIISLLATGVTRENLSSGNVLASRALLLLGKELYRKIFKKNDAETPKTDSIFNRLSVEYSGADPRTGEQSATAKYKVSDHVVLIGDIGIAGGFRGLVKYVIRFR
ncbi:MAG: translocation/assembly module TamB domain-containing protein [Chthoniobacterales bacterium]|nr:translocation/assembly module TamB domain-containing protein [Chthoniobacterales bacterium]